VDSKSEGDSSFRGIKLLELGLLLQAGVVALAILYLIREVMKK
jgi:hypothetical protein